MEMTSTRNVPAPVATVWAALNDPAILTASIPGCESFTPDGENAYKVALAARVGPVAAKFNGRMQLSEVDPPRGYTLSFDGQGGAAGFAKGEAKVSLASDASGTGTALSYTVKAQVGGKIAQIGSRLIDGAAQKLADDFFARFAEAVASAAAGVADSAREGTSVPAATAEGGRSVAIPPTEGGRWVRYAALALLAAVLIVAYFVTRAAK